MSSNNIKVLKRNGNIEDFDFNKIIKAVSLAGERINKKLDNKTTTKLKNLILNNYLDLSERQISVDDIHLAVENALAIIDKEIHKQYRDYVGYKKSLYSVFKNISEKSKRIVYSGDKENANKDSSIVSTKKELLSGLLSEELMLNFELDKDIAKAHKDGYIYIHDLRDRKLNSINCIDENGWISFKNENGIKYIQLKELSTILNIEEGVNQISKKCYVLGRNGWTRLKGVMKRPVKPNELIYNFKTRSGYDLRTTSNHKIPVIRDNQELILKAEEIKKGDYLLTSDGVNSNLNNINNACINLFNSNDNSISAIVNIDQLKKYIEYKYDISIQDLLIKGDYDIDCSNDLKYLTTDEFKYLNDLIKIPYETMLKLKIHTEKDILPMLLPITENLARLFGYIHANGKYVNDEQFNYKIVFTSTDIDAIKDFIYCFEDCFDIKLNIVKSNDNSSYYKVCCNSKILVKLFFNFTDENNIKDITIPNFVLNGSERIKMAYLFAYVKSTNNYSDQILNFINKLGYDISDMANLNKELSMFNDNSYYEKYEDKLSQDFIESEILDIHTTTDGTYVYDLETESNWFIVNDYVVHNCMLCDVGNILKGGFNINGVQIEEPHTIETAIDLLNDIIMITTSQQYGGWTFPECDKVLGKYAQKSYNKMLEEYKGIFTEQEIEERLYKNIKKKLKSLQYKINCVNNSNGQTAFTTFSFGLGTNKYERMISTALLEVRMEKMGTNKITAIFPKLIFLHRKEINGEVGSPNYDIKELAIKCSMKNLYPDWLSLDAGNLKETYDRCGKAVSAMGCRAFLSPWKNEQGEEVYVGRFNIGAITLLLPRYALEAKGDEDKFFELLDKYFDLALKLHLYTYERMSKVKSDTNPLFFIEGGCAVHIDSGDTIEKALECATASFGYIGLTEACYRITGKPLDENIDFGVKVLSHIKNKIDEASKKYHRLFALYGTPAEGLCSKALQNDKAKYGVVEGVTDKEWYTNSHHISVTSKISAIKKVQLESKLYKYPTGGRIFYTEWSHGENFTAVKEFIDYCMDKGLYMGINLENSTCQDCGAEGDFKDGVCKECGSTNVTTVDRVCGLEY